MRARASCAGSTARSWAGEGRRLGLAAICALGAWLALGGVAEAAPSYGVVGSFAQGSAPEAVAVDQASDTVYVGDVLEGLQKFDSSGTPLGPLSGCAGYTAGCIAAGVAVDPLNGNVYAYDLLNGVIDTLDPSSGAVVSSFPVTGGQHFVQIASDASGDVYYPNQADNTVQEFSPGGTLLATFAGGGTVGAFNAPQGVAVDSSGDVYVADSGNGRVVRIAGTAGQTDPTGAQSVLDTGGSQDVAVDPGSGDVFVADLGGSGYHVVAYHADGTGFADFGQGTIGQGSFPVRVAFDDTTSHVYVTDDANSQVWIFGPPLPTVTTGQATGVQSTSATTSATLNGTVNPNGVQLTDCHFDYGTDSAYGQTAPCVPDAASIPPDSSDHAVSADISGLTLNTTYHFRLDATSANGTADGQDQTFSTPDRPSIDGAYTQNATFTSVDLVAQINPGRADTTYHFEWGTSNSYGTSVPVPDADIGSGTTDVTVSQHLGGLTPNTTYHWRVVATNSVDTTTGVDHTFVYQTAAGLPDGRGYEVVSSAKNDNDAMGSPLATTHHTGGGPHGLVSRDGGRLLWDNPGTGPYSNPSNGAVDVFAATRTSSGWSQSVLVPPDADGSTSFHLAAASEDLSNVLLTAQSFDPATGSSSNLTLLERRADGSFATIATGLPTSRARLSPDGSHAFFETTAQLAGDTHTSGDQLYEWTAGGGLRVAALDDAGNPTSPCGATFTMRVEMSYPDVSPDGSRFFFQSPDAQTSGCGPSELYVRESDSTTVEISKPPAGVTDRGATFTGATPDGSKVFFTTATQLTPDDSNTDPDLYEYDLATGALTRLSVGAPGYDDADLSTGVGSDLTGSALVSADGSHAYFTALGQLAPGAGATQAANESQDTVNLYAYADGHVSFIATIGPADDTGESGTYHQGGGPPLSTGVAQVTADGSDLVFDSESRLTAYDNAGRAELYRYDAPSATIACVSCSPMGTLPDGVLDPLFHTSFRPVDATVPVAQLNGLSADGQTVFFAATSQLLPAATNVADSVSGNPIYNVYAWHDGMLSLISSGTSPSSDFLLGASPSGSDLFLLTASQLAPQDGDSANDIYDARVGGGFPVPPTPAPCASGDTCAPLSSAPPSPPTPASITFTGPGNPSPPAAAARVKILSRVVHGSRFVLKVRVPGTGRITITGAGIRTVRRSVARAGAYKIKVTLTANKKRALEHKRKLKLNLRVAYAPATGTASAATVSLTVEPAAQSGHKSSNKAKRASHSMGGAR